MLAARRPALLVGALAILAAACGKSSTQPSCTFSVSTLSFSFGAPGGNGTVSVSTGQTCDWTARSDASWVSITGASSGKGPGSINFTAVANTDVASRTGSLTIADQQVRVTQEGAAPLPCEYDISPSTATLMKDAGGGSFSVTTGEGCPWTASASASWVTIAPGSTQGTSTGTVSYSVARNTDVGGRSATIVVAGKTFTITQAGDIGVCQYSVAPVNFTPCMRATTMTTAITTEVGCPWTATSISPWLSIGSGSGSGSGAILLSVTDNYDAPRSGVVQVRWPTPTAGQNLQIAQAGCYYSVTKSSIAFAASGGNDSFMVYQASDPVACGGPLQDACLWTATADVPWITVSPSGQQRDDQVVKITVAPNTTGSTRSGHVTVRDKVVLITQS